MGMNLVLLISGFMKLIQPQNQRTSELRIVYFLVPVERIKKYVGGKNDYREPGISMPTQTVNSFSLITSGFLGNRLSYLVSAEVSSKSTLTYPQFC